MLKDILQKKKSVIVENWLAEIIGEYSSGTASFLNRSNNRFANPVGHDLRVGTQAIFENLAEGMEAEKVCRYLDGIIRSRAIQDFTPSQAISFIFSLKKVIRAELDVSNRDPQFQIELADLESDIDQLTLFAFDIYTKCRERLCELRVNEMKNSVAAVMNRFNEGSFDPKPAVDRSGTNSKCNNLQRGGDR